MKRIMLILLLLPFLSRAQQITNLYPNGENQKLNQKVKTYYEPSLIKASPVDKRAGNRVTISTSGNALAVGSPSVKNLSADQSTMTLSFAHRGNVSVNAIDVGDILVAVSKDLGATWKDYMVLRKDTMRHNRYPSSALLNPTGNTDPNKVVVTYAGTSHDNWPTTTHWYYPYFGNINVDSTDNFNEYIRCPKTGTDTTDQVVTLDYLATCDDQTAHGISYIGYYNISPSKDTVTERYIMVKNGLYNPTQKKYTWSQASLLLPNLYLHSSATRLKLKYRYIRSHGSAWSQDGNSGYIYFFASDQNHPLAEQLFVYKSTDKGANWNLVCDTNLCNDTTVTNYLRPMRGTIARRPLTLENDAVVDNNGKLHIMALFASASTNNIDSLDYLWTTYASGNAIPEPIFHITVNGGNAIAEFIDTIRTVFVRSTDVPAFNYGWDHRLAASRTQDGTKIFAVWTDTDPFGSHINEYPDIISWGKDLTGTTPLPLRNHTKNTPEEADNYFVVVSPITLYQAPNKYYIPVVTTVRGNAYTNPVIHKYANNIGYNIVGMQERQNSAFSVSGNYPNPFTTETYVNIDLNKRADVSITVVNMMGQAMQNINYGTLATGQHQLKVDGTGLGKGVYFVVVNAGGYSQSLKVMVE